MHVHSQAHRHTHTHAPPGVEIVLKAILFTWVPLKVTSLYSRLWQKKEENKPGKCWLLLGWNFTCPPHKIVFCSCWYLVLLVPWLNCGDGSLLFDSRFKSFLPACRMKRNLQFNWWMENDGRADPLEWAAICSPQPPKLQDSKSLTSMDVYTYYFHVEQFSYFWFVI